LTHNAKHRKGQFIVAAAMFIALIILSMSILIYSAGSRYQTLEKEPVREIVQTITDDFKRMLTIALADYARSMIEIDWFEEVISDWAEKTQYCYSGMGLQLSTYVEDLTYQASDSFFQIRVDAMLKMNITSLGFYGYEYPTSIHLTAGKQYSKAFLDGSGANYTLKELNITLQANREDYLPASDLVITGVDIIMHYYSNEDVVALGKRSEPKSFTGKSVTLTLEVSNMDMIIVHVMTKDSVTVYDVKDNTSSYTRAHGYTGPPSIETWYLLNPQNGIHEINVIMNNDIKSGGVVCAFSLKNVNTTDPIGATSQSNGGLKKASFSIDTESDNSWIISIIGTQDNVNITAGQPVIWSFRSKDKYASDGTYMMALTKGSYTQSWNFSKATEWSAVSVEVKGRDNKQQYRKSIDISDFFDIQIVSGEGIYKIVLKKNFDTKLSTSTAYVFKYEIRVTFVDSRGIQGTLTFEFPYP